MVVQKVSLLESALFSEIRRKKRVAREEQFEKLKAENQKEEFCNFCLKLMGFPKALHFEHPQRNQDGARYVGNGFGQLCRDCNKPSQ